MWTHLLKQDKETQTNRDHPDEGCKKKQTSGWKQRVIGWLGGGGLLLHHSPPGLSGDGSQSRAGRRAGRRAGVAVVGPVGFDLVDESFYGGELLGEVAQVSFESVELLVEVV